VWGVPCTWPLRFYKGKATPVSVISGAWALYCMSFFLDPACGMESTKKIFLKTFFINL